MYPDPPALHSRSEDWSSGRIASGQTDPRVTTRVPRDGEGAIDSNGEGSCRQTAFEAAKREIALYPFQQKKRQETLQETGA